MSNALSALGIDVGEHSLDMVLLSDGREVMETRGRSTVADLQVLIVEHRPSVIAIDCPSGWARRPRRRECETTIGRLGVNCFSTPIEAVGLEGSFYRWIIHGLTAYACCAAAGYVQFGTGRVGVGNVVEVFPYASVVALLGGLPTPGRSAKKVTRANALIAAGVSVERLRTIDLVDAGLAALTGLLALEGHACAVGDPDEGTIVLPTVDLPTRYVRLEPWARASSPRPLTVPDDLAVRLREVSRTRMIPEEEFLREVIEAFLEI
jgi:predicted nuclease with RNAse H fold